LKPGKVFTWNFLVYNLEILDEPYFTRCHRDETIINAMRAWMHLPPISVQEVVDKLIAEGH
jgi:hypothetical protein